MARSVGSDLHTSPDSFDEAVRIVQSSGIVSQRRVGRWVMATVVLLIVAFGVQSLARNEAIEWPVVAQYFTSESVLQGLWLTLWLTVAVCTFGFVLGAVLAVCRLSGSPILSSLSWAYVWVFRSTPLLVQLLVWYNIGYLYPRISFGVPFGPTFFSTDAVNLISSTSAALIGLTLHEAAYACEIVRGGMLSVDQGQVEAADALGLRRRRIIWRIVLPQAMRSIIPPAGNMVIGVLKATSIASVISVTDLLYSVQVVYNVNYKIIPLLMVATLWYIAVTSVLSIGQYYVERHYARGALRTMPPTPIQRARQTLRQTHAKLHI